MLFDHIQAAPADPILGLGEAFKAETRAEKSIWASACIKTRKGKHQF